MAKAATEPMLHMSWSDFSNRLAEMVRQIPTAMKASGGASVNAFQTPSLLKQASGSTGDDDPIGFWKGQIEKLWRNARNTSLGDTPTGMNSTAEGQPPGRDGR